jgi:hypothetical protein
MATKTHKRMEMPDSSAAPATETAKSTWDTIHSSLPVSYQIAIALDAFVMFITFAALLLLALYVRKQIKRRRQLADDDLEMKCCGGKIDNMYSDIMEKPDKKRSGGLLGKLTGKKPKGHVRWTSSVEACTDDNSFVKMKMKSESSEWETDTWSKGSNSSPQCIALETEKPRSIHNAEDLGASYNVGMRGGGTVGFRVNPLGGAGTNGGINNDGRWERGSLWKSIKAKKAKERAQRSRERIAAGYDGFRGN